MMQMPMERVATQTLLGIQFWDPVMGYPISEGLWARAQRLSDDQSSRLGRVVVGRATPSGVIAFFGLAPEERVEDDPQKQLWQTTPDVCPIAIDVEDLQGRYLPMSFVVPMPHKGALKIDLWSASSRSVPSALAVIHAQIAIGSGENPDPAAYALVEARLANQGNQGGVGPWVYRGLTNEKGTLLLPCPYPPVPTPEGNNFNYPALDKQTFNLTITVRYERQRQQPLQDSAVPNLETILNQKVARILVQGSPQDSMPEILKFGQPLVLRTEAKDSYLRIQPQ